MILGHYSDKWIQAATVLSLAGHPVHFFLRQLVSGDHVSAHVLNGGEGAVADGARGLPRVFLHVLSETPAQAVGGPAGTADVRTAGWKQRGVVMEGIEVDSTTK